MKLWESIKGWMGSGFSVFVYIAIVLLFIIGIVKCIVPVARNRKLLLRAIKNIKKGDKAHRSWQEDKFLGRGSLLPHWSEYLNNLFFADGEYHNPSSVEDYINEETVIEEPGRVRLGEALPGVLVSLGFLGTLMGLSVALSGMGAATASEVADSMTTLLSSMKYAFVTSIFGVVASVTFTLLTRAVNGAAQRTLLAFYNAMSRCAGVVSVDPMTQIAIYQQEQSSMLKQLTDAIGGENIKAILVDVISPLTKAIEKTVNFTCEQQQSLMQGVADAYIAKMDEAMHGQFDKLSVTLDETCRYQERTIKSVADSLTAFTDAARSLRDIKQQTGELFEKYQQLLIRLSNAESTINDDVARIEATEDAQNEFLSELSRQQNAVTAATEKLESGSAKLLAQSADKLTSAAKQLSDTMQTARGKLQKDMDESLNYFEGSMTEIIKRIDRATKQIKDSVSELPAAVEAASGEYIKQLKLLSDTLAAARPVKNRKENT